MPAEQAEWVQVQVQVQQWEQGRGQAGYQHKIIQASLINIPLMARLQEEQLPEEADELHLPLRGYCPEGFSYSSTDTGATAYAHQVLDSSIRVVEASS